MTFTTPQPVSLEVVREEAGRIGHADAQIQGRGAASGPSGDAYRDFSLRTESLTTSEAQSFQSSLTRAVNAEAFGVKNVSASFGRQIARGAVLAIIVSLFLIVLYISARFEWKFALPVLIALAHDIIITIGVYALLGQEVTTATVAAVLTVLGYSIYDTIIIFDRIRENIPLMKRASFRVIGNVSLWETIPRSLATTFITLLPILSLLLFGGATLKDFAFALLIGIGRVRTHSIFIGAPLVAVFKEREPEFARRRDDESAIEGSVGAALLDTPAEAAAAIDAEAEPALAAAAAAVTAPPAPPSDGPTSAAAAANRERRRQRRSGRPHGRVLAEHLFASRIPPGGILPLGSPPCGRGRSLKASRFRGRNYLAVLQTACDDISQARLAWGCAVADRRMGAMSAEPDHEPRTVSELLLAGIGWATMSVEAIEEIADDLARRVGVERDAMREAVSDTVASWRSELERVGARRDEAMERALAKAGLARREEVEDLALRVAQLEHRLRLLERDRVA